MAGEAKPPGPNLGGNGFVWVAVLAAVLAYASGRSSLENLRPQAKAPATIVTNARQDIEARLWQDPFQTVIDADGGVYGWTRTSSQKSGATLHPCLPLGSTQNDTHCQPLLEQANTPAPQAAGKKPLPQQTANTSPVQLIGIIVPGGSYSEDAEFRRRTRYAVLAALDVLGYTPNDPQHIGVFIPPPPAQKQSDNGSSSERAGPQFVPYEVMGRGDTRLILLWLDEDALGEDPLHRLVMLFRGLGLGPTDGPRVKILGPQGSDTLLAMLRNTSTLTKDDAAAVAGLDLYDYSATADPAALCRELQAQGCDGPGDWVVGEFAPAGIHFLRATATDDVLARAISAELAGRGIRPQSSNIALISEWDTFYGRTLPETVARCLDVTSLGKACNESKTDSEINDDTHNWLHRYSYLRGLDGQAPGASTAMPAASSDAASKSITGTAQDSTTPLLSETAQGDGQGDYLTRLATELRDTDAQLRRAHQEGIRAVGILGSDLYDKLLVFQAVKSALPRAIFFTTDLDQRLIHPAGGFSTVNLIVASGLGLTLNDDLQRDIPPFRGSYQTAAFLATLMAACAPMPPSGQAFSNCPDSAAIGTASGWFGRATTYEIGRSRTLPLDAGSQGAARKGQMPGCPSSRAPPDVFQCASIAPGDPPLHSWAMRVSGLVLLEAGAVFVLAAFLLWLGAGQNLWRVAALIAIAFTAIRWLDPGLLAPRDMSALFQGVSLLPSICIQLLSGIFGIAVIFNIRRTSQENLIRLRTRLHMSSILQDLEKTRPERRMRPRDMLPFGVRTHDETTEADGNVDQSPDRSPAPWTRFWVRYVDYAGKRTQLWRVLAFTLVGLLIALTVYLAFPWSDSPSGAATSYTYTAMALFDGVTTLAVALYVADITLFSRLFVREAFARDDRLPIWPRKAREAFATSSLRTTFTGQDDAQDALVTTTMTIAYVTERTTCITTFIYYPFIMIALSVIARSPALGPSTFDPWVIAVQAVGLLAAVVSAVALRSAAEDARRETVRSLNFLKWQALTPGSPAELRQRLDLLVEWVTGLRDGAFSPLSQQPVVRALLLPLASYGSTLLLNLF